MRRQPSSAQAGVSAQSPPGRDAARDDPPARPGSATDVLLVLDRHGYALTRDFDGEGYIAFAGERFARFGIGSEESEAATRVIYDAARGWRAGGQWHPAPVSRSAMATVTAHLRAMAMSVPRVQHWQRCADHERAMWIDLGRPSWDAIRITAHDCRVVDGRAVPFLRPRGMLPLPRPARRPDALAQLRGLLPPMAEGDFMGCVLFLLACLLPKGPAPLLVLSGPGGSFKSTTALMLRRLVDPNVQGLSALPERARDLTTMGEHGRVLVLDNLSELDDQWVDHLCKRSQGVTSAYRTNYTDRGLTLLCLRGPTLLTSAINLVGRWELARRCLFVDLGRDRPVHRGIAQQDLERRLTDLAPGVLETLARGLQVGLENLSKVHEFGQFSLVDFARFAQAAAPAFGWTAEAVRSELDAHVARQKLIVVDNDPVAYAICDMVHDLARKAIGRLSFDDGQGLPWTGNVAMLLRALNERNPASRYARDWPQHPSQLGRRLEQIKDALTEVGVVMTRHRSESAARGHHGMARRLELDVAPGDAASPAVRAQPWVEEEVDEMLSGRLN